MVSVLELVDERAEELLLAGVLMNPTLLGKAGEYGLTYLDFYNDEYRKLYNEIFNCYLEGKLSRSEILKRLRKKGFSEELISHLLSGSVDELTFERAVLRVKELSQKRQLSSFLSHMQERLSLQDVEQIIKSLLVFIDNFGSVERKTVDYYQVGLDISDFANLFLSAGKAQPVGITTGFAELDNLTGGFRKGELIVVFGDAGVGKTGFMLSMALNIARQGKSVGIASYELDREAISERILSIASYVPLSKIRQRAFTPEDVESITRACAELSTLKLFVFPALWFTLSELFYKTKRLKEEHGLDVLFVDYLQLISPDRHRETRKEELEDTMRILKRMAHLLSVPVVLLATPLQEKPKERERVEGHADTVIWLKRPKENSPQDKGIAELVVVKNNQGQTGRFHLAFMNTTTAFRELTSNYLRNIWDIEEDDWDLDL